MKLILNRKSTVTGEPIPCTEHPAVDSEVSVKVGWNCINLCRECGVTLKGLMWNHEEEKLKEDK